MCHGLIALEQVVGASGAKLGGLRCACMWHREQGGREGGTKSHRVGVGVCFGGCGGPQVGACSLHVFFLTCATYDA